MPVTGSVYLNSWLLGEKIFFLMPSSCLPGTIKLIGFPARITGLDREIKRRWESSCWKLNGPKQNRGVNSLHSDSFPVIAPFPALGLPASRSLSHTGSQQAGAICLQLLTPFSQATSGPFLSLPSNKHGWFFHIHIRSLLAFILLCRDFLGAFNGYTDSALLGPRLGPVGLGPVGLGPVVLPLWKTVVLDAKIWEEQKSKRQKFPGCEYIRIAEQGRRFLPF